MSEYSSPSPFDQIVEKATTDTSEEANWALILEICDKAGQTTTGSKDCIKSVMKRLMHSSKNVQSKAITLLDACVLNCGTPFHNEVATPEFVKETRAFLGKVSSDAADQFKNSLKKWAESEFKSDTKLSVIPTYYQALRSEGAYFGMGGGTLTTTPLKTTTASSTPAPASTDEDLERAIALSLKESQSKSHSTSLYPQMSSLNAQPAHTAATVPYSSSSRSAPIEQPSGHQVRALYDFEAVEDNELTFKTGELITVLDDSDPNWWKGTTWRGEGLFPVNFVTTDISLEASNELGDSEKKTVQFNEEVQVEQFDPNTVQIDETVIDQALDEIQNADPTGLTDDSPEMLHLEEECKVMGPLIDQELEQIDSKHNELMGLNQKLTDAFQLYTRLMKEAANVPQYSAPVSYMQQQAMSATLPANYLPPPPQQQQAMPGAMYSYNPHQEPATQTYYGTGAYGGPPVMSHPNPQEQQQPPFSQASMLQQYTMSGTGMSNLQYLPSTDSPAGMDGLQQTYNTTQPGYHQQMQPPQQLS